MKFLKRNYFFFQQRRTGFKNWADRSKNSGKNSFPLSPGLKFIAIFMIYASNVISMKKVVQVITQQFQQFEIALASF